MTNKVYLVGDENSPKTNQWLSMTNSLEEAERLMAEQGHTATMREVAVPPSRSKGGKR